VSVVPGVSLVPPNGAPRKDTTVLAALHLEAAQLREAGVQVEVALLHGKVERALGRLCNEVSAGLLVIGDNRHPTRSSFFATPVDRIASGVSLPLLVVRSQKPFEAWARGERPLKVLLAVDHTWSSAVARAWLTGLAAYGALEVVATHVWAPEEERLRRGGSEGSMAEQLTRETQAALEGLPGNVTSRVLLEIGRGHVGAMLLDVAAREEVDMMVLGSHGPQGLLARLRSVSHEVLAHAMMSVALVPGEGHVVEELGRSTPTSPVTMRRLGTR
jgi:nucleotide-binding universal stress UspA family protein